MLTMLNTDKPLKITSMLSYWCYSTFSVLWFMLNCNKFHFPRLTFFHCFWVPSITNIYKYNQQHCDKFVILNPFVFTPLQSCPLNTSLIQSSTHQHPINHSQKHERILYHFPLTTIAMETRQCDPPHCQGDQSYPHSTINCHVSLNHRAAVHLGWDLTCHQPILQRVYKLVIRKLYLL